MICRNVKFCSSDTELVILYEMGFQLVNWVIHIMELMWLIIRYSSFHFPISILFFVSMEKGRKLTTLWVKIKNKNFPKFPFSSFSIPRTKLARWQKVTLELSERSTSFLCAYHNHMIRSYTVSFEYFSLRKVIMKTKLIFFFLAKLNY